MQLHEQIFLTVPIPTRVSPPCAVSACLYYLWKGLLDHQWSPKAWALTQMLRLFVYDFPSSRQNVVVYASPQPRD